MQGIADRTFHFQESVIREMTRIAIREKAVNLSQGLPDFSAPPELVDAAKKYIGSEFDQYSITYGDYELRRRIAEDLKQSAGIEYDPEDEITITCGVSEAIMSAVMAVVNPGEEVLFFEPYYENYLPGVVLAGGVYKGIELIPRQWDFDQDTLKKSVSGKTKALILNTPMNPTGKVFNAEELRIISEICLENNMFLITDEIYRHIIFEGEHVSPASMPGMSDYTALTGGFSKTYSCTGWRVGYAAAKGDLSQAIRKVHDYLTICAPHPFQKACIAGLDMPEAYYKSIRDGYRRKRDILCGGLLNLGFKLSPPQGAYYVLADFSALSDMSDSDFALELARDGGVGVVPGSSFYINGERGSKLLRFCFAMSEEILVEALERLHLRLK